MVVFPVGQIELFLCSEGPSGEINSLCYFQNLSFIQDNIVISLPSTTLHLYLPRVLRVNLPDESNDVDDPEFSPVGQDVFEVDPSELFDSGNTLFDSRLGGNVGRALRMSAKEKGKGGLRTVALRRCNTCGATRADYIPLAD